VGVDGVTARELHAALTAAVQAGAIEPALVDALLAYLSHMAEVSDTRRRSVGVARTLRSEQMHRAAREALHYVRIKWPTWGPPGALWKAQILLHKDPVSFGITAGSTSGCMPGDGVWASELRSLFGTTKASTAGT
jgi:hypothetical protein